MALTGKKQKFAAAKGKGMSNKDAAIEAGYSPASAGAAGSRLAKDPDVLAALDRKAKVRAVKKVPPAKEGSPPKSRPAADAPKPKFDLATALSHSDPKAFLLAAMNDIELEPRQRIEAAKTLMPFMHQKLGEGGKKDQQAAEAKKAASRFAPAAPPKVVAAGGKKV